MVQPQKNPNPKSSFLIVARWIVPCVALGLLLVVQYTRTALTASLQSKLPTSQQDHQRINGVRSSTSGTIHARCPQIDILNRPHSFWTVEHDPALLGWSYYYRSAVPSPTRSSGNTSPPQYHQVKVAQQAPFQQKQLQSILSPTPTSDDYNNHTKNLSVVFYGSSHLRELYFALVRLSRGIKYDAPLEPAIMTLRSGLPEAQRLPRCDADNSGWITALYGIDIEACGPPTYKLAPELSSPLLYSNNNNNNNNNNTAANVALGFKTFLHTPDADELFVQYLEQQSSKLRHPSVLVVAIGIWGTRGNRFSLNFTRTQTALTATQEADYYLNWLETTFPHSKIVYVYESGVDGESLKQILLPRLLHRTMYSTSTKENSNQDASSEALSHSSQDAILIRKDIIVGTKPPTLPCAHGCGGPVTMVIAQIFLDWLSRATTGPERCL